VAAESAHFWTPEWPLPQGVYSAISQRHGGYSLAPYQTLNLGDHVGDVPDTVTRNRLKLRETLQLPVEPLWLRQVHGTQIVQIDSLPHVISPPEADGVVATVPGAVLAVLTADCLPVLACSLDGQKIGAFHAGWRGLLDGILEKGLAALAVPSEQVLIYLGPAIGPDAFEVGPELRAAFLAEDPGCAAAFKAGSGDRWLADIYALARYRLQRMGVFAIYGGGLCTFSNPDYFSYRRDGITGRMASLIWRENG